MNGTWEEIKPFMQRLIAKLRELQDDPTIKAGKQITLTMVRGHDELMDKIEQYCRVLISPNGIPRAKCIQMLEANGFKTKVVYQMKTSWPLINIQTSKGLLLYK